MSVSDYVIDAYLQRRMRRRPCYISLSESHSLQRWHYMWTLATTQRIQTFTKAKP